MMQALAIFQQAQLERRLMAMLLSEPMPHGVADCSNCAASMMPSPRLASVVGHKPTTAPLAATAWYSPGPCGWRG
jgi:hypothetical protein